MALTTDQEEVLKQIIEAFQNGKRIQDLPAVKGTDPYKMLVEVIDEDGESKKAAPIELVPYVEQNYAYGVEFDVSVSSPTCTRIGNSDLHKSCPIQNGMRGCLLADDGTVQEYLEDGSWENATRDGSKGQVMVEIPRHYRRFETEGNKRRVYLSEIHLPGFEVVPKMYVSAYEAALDRTNSKLASVVNTTEQYRGGNNNADYDAASNTFLGRPVTQVNRTNFRKYARNRNTDTTEWNCMTYLAQKTLYWLFVVEYATLNTQAAFNAERTEDGFRQGGLGDGVSNINRNTWNTFNGRYPFIPCGYTDSLGNGTGCIDYEMPTEYSATTVKVSVPRYHGIENPFGHIWQWTDGINVKRTSGDTGTSQVFVCYDPSKFSDTAYDGYEYVGDEARTEGYIKEEIFGAGGEIIPKTVGGSSSTFFCDYHHTNQSNGLFGLLFGGSAYRGSSCGLADASSSDVPSYADSNIGSRLCFHPSTE